MSLVLYKIIILCSTKCAWKFSLSLPVKDYFCPARMNKLSFKHSFEGKTDPAFRKKKKNYLYENISNSCRRRRS